MYFTTGMEENREYKGGIICNTTNSEIINILEYWECQIPRVGYIIWDENVILMFTDINQRKTTMLKKIHLSPSPFSEFTEMRDNYVTPKLSWINNWWHCRAFNKKTCVEGNPIQQVIYPYTCKIVTEIMEKLYASQGTQNWCT